MDLKTTATESPSRRSKAEAEYPTLSQKIQPEYPSWESRMRMRIAEYPTVTSVDSS
jgi:hypothetical protein